MHQRSGQKIVLNSSKPMNSNDYYDWSYNLTFVDKDEIIPKIKVYDPDGSFWFSKIGFNRKITDKD